jgi:O-antigen/teichoic acid export membrane protein
MALWKVQNGVLSAAVMASVVLTTPTVLGMTIAYFASTVIANAYFTWRTFQTYRPPASTSSDDLSYGKHLSVMGSFGIIATQFDNIVVYQLLGPAALATYSFALLIPERMRTLLGFIPNIALPKLSQRNAEDLRTTATHRSLLGLIFASGVAIVYALAAPFIFSIFFPQYQDAVAYTQLASLFALTLVPTYLSTVLTAQGAKRALYIVSIASPIVKTVLSIFCIFAFGLWGAIAARIVAAAFSGATSYALLMRQTDGKPLQS